MPGGGRGESNDTTPWYQRPWAAKGLNGIIAFSILAALVVGLRAIRKERQSIDWSQVELARNYERFTALLQRASGQPRRPSQTASEYLAAVSPKLGSAYPEASRINQMFETILYAPERAEKPAAEDLKAPIIALKKSLRDVARESSRRPASANGDNGLSDTSTPTP